MISRTQLTQNIRQEAQRLGFSRVGITSPDAPAHWDVYFRWLEAGHHAEMDWIATERARQRRADPRLILPECKSILVLGVDYEPPPSAQPPSGAGQIASYAWGQDYHDVLPPRLRALVAFIEQETGTEIPNRWYTDTGPILERELAQRAGLGWIGKNGQLINPAGGSYFLLAEILLGIELSPDEPFQRDHCGTCTRCLEACPTTCILPDRTVDSNRCISYLTIEHKGVIPEKLRPQLGNWIFGCDICQQVCPWNGKQNLPTAFKWDGRASFDTYPNLIGELALTPQEFNRKFKGTSIKRAKRRGYLRNVAVALGNQPTAEALPALTRALQDAEPLVRAHAAWALGRLGGSSAKIALETAARQETDPQVLGEIQLAAEQCDSH